MSQRPYRPLDRLPYPYPPSPVLCCLLGLGQRVDEEEYLEAWKERGVTLLDLTPPERFEQFVKQYQAFYDFERSVAVDYARERHASLWLELHLDERRSFETHGA